MSFSRAAVVAAVAGLSAGPTLVHAQTPGDQQLPPVTVTAPAPGPQVSPVSPQIDRYAPPQTIESTDQRKIEDTTNIIDSGDAVKYMPSLLLRKRNYGDTQPTLATRTWGINSSARTLVYVDDIPHLGADLQQQHQRRAALGPGVAGGDQGRRLPLRPVLGRLARQLDRRRAADHHAHARQARGDAEADRGAADLRLLQHLRHAISPPTPPARSAARSGGFSFFLAANREESFSQPLAFVTNGAAFAAGTQGTIPATDQDRHRRQRGRRGRAAAQHHGQLQAQARRSISTTG